MMRLFLLFLCFLEISYVNANESEKKQKNICKEAINKNTSFRVTGIFGSSLESEWPPAASYVLLKEMKRFLVLQREYVKKKSKWRFEFSEMVGGKTVVFVYHEKILKNYCRGSNAFFIVRKQ